MEKGQQTGHSQTAGAKLQNERARVRSPQAGRQKVYDTARLAGLRVGQGLTEKVKKPHTPVAGRRAGNARNQKPEGHRAGGCSGSERSAENGQVSELQMQPVGGNPEKVPSSEGGPDGN